MICRMCLADSSEFINIFDSEGTDLNVGTVITKHFWFEPKNDDPISNMICYTCWWKIDTFHNYYTSIEEAHRKLSERFSVKPECKEDNNKTEDNSCEIEVQYVVEEENVKEISIENEDPMSDTGLETEYVNVISIQEDDDSDTEIAIYNNLLVDGDGEEHCSEKEISDEIPLKDLADKIKSQKVLQNPKSPEISKNSSSEVLRRSSPRSLKANAPFEKRRKRGRPRKVDPVKNSDDLNSSNVSEEPLSSIHKGKDEKESQYIKKSKEDDEKIAKHMKLKCELCASEFCTFADVKKHYREVHRRKGYIICCNKKLYKRVLILDHINKHLNPDYFRCEICKKRFSDKQCLKNHMIRHESEEVKIYKCEKCPRRYAKQYLLDNHKLIHIPQDQREFFCNECGKAFPSNNLLQTHVRYVHENAYGKMCHICAKVIRGKTMFEKHQLEHAGIVEPKVQCTQCGAWLKHEYSLKKHMARHAEQHYSHVCNVCGKVAPSKGALRSHIQYVHASQRTHQCSICDKAFKKAINLKEHMTTHTGEVLYTCPHCPKTFNSSANMHSHRKKVHRKEWEESRRKRGLPQTDYNKICTDGDQDDAESTLVVICETIEDSPTYSENKSTLCESN